MVKVGLTGGIGAGKSMVASFLNNIGIPVYNSDFKAKEILFSSQKVIELVGNNIDSEVISDNKIDKAKLTEIVFSNPEKLEILNNIIHPILLGDFNKWCDENNKNAIVVIEAAILFESGFYKHVDKTITVSSSEDNRISRVVKRDYVNEEQVVSRLKNQMTDNEREKFSDFVIINEKRELVIPQILDILDRLRISI